MMLSHTIMHVDYKIFNTITITIEHILNHISIITIISSISLPLYIYPHSHYINHHLKSSKTITLKRVKNKNHANLRKDDIYKRFDGGNGDMVRAHESR